MDTVHIAAALIKPAAGLVNQTPGIDFPDFFCGLRSVKLPPSLIKRNPYRYTGVIVQCGYHILKIGVILSPSFPVLSFEYSVVTVADPPGEPVRGIGEMGHKNHVVFTAPIGHILPYHHPQPVTVVIKTFRLYLYVFPDCIVSHLLQLDNIIYQGLIAGRSHQAFRPVALIQNPVKEIRFVIQEKSQNAFPVPAGR